MWLKNKNIKLIIASCTGVLLLIIVLFMMYFFGQPGKSFSKPSGLEGRANSVLANTYVLFSVNNLSETNKLISLSNTRLGQLENASTEVDQISSLDSLAAYTKKTDQSFIKLSGKDQLISREKFLNLITDRFYSEMNSSGCITNSNFQTISEIINSNINKLPANNTTKNTLQPVISNYQPEISTKGAKLAGTVVQVTKMKSYVPITTVNSDFIKSKIKTINHQPSNLNAINVLRTKGIISAINIIKSSSATTTAPTYNTQVLFFKNTSRGLVYVKFDYFEGEADANYFIDHFPTIYNNLGVNFNELYWLGYFSDYSPLNPNSDIVNYY